MQISWRLHTIVLAVGQFDNIDNDGISLYSPT